MTKRAMASASAKNLLDFFKPSTKRHKATISSSSSQTIEIPVTSRTSFPCVSSSRSAADSGFLKQKKVDHDAVEGTRCVRLEELLVEKTWIDVLSGEFRKPYGRNLCAFVEKEVSGTQLVYPPLHLVFNALNSTPLDQVKAVIIGQDPYHGPGQAMGLSFSVPEGIKAPSSLVNIFKELKQDIGCSIPSHGNLERWAAQGVLLLNTVLTVRSHQANSHAKKGWETFTDAIIQKISQKKEGVVFLLWGNFAQGKSKLIDERKHHILKAAHPSGLSANRGFFGCRHFSQANEILERIGHSPIDWQLWESPEEKIKHVCVGRGTKGRFIASAALVILRRIAKEGKACYWSRCPYMYAESALSKLYYRPITWVHEERGEMSWHKRQTQI